MDFFATYDCETITVKIPETQQLRGYSTRHEAELVLASISICSSIPGYQSPRFLLCDGSPQKLVGECVDYLLEISQRASFLLKKRFSLAMSELNRKISSETDEKYKKFLQKLGEKLNARTDQLHVYGWNSSGFDLPLLRLYLFEEFRKRDMPIKKLLKKTNSYLLLATQHFKFLDMQALISPSASYASWLKSLGILGAEKSHFPFTWFDSLERLKEKHLPPRHFWDNDLKNQKLSDDDWKEIQIAWTTNKMKTMRDFLEYYNNKDVSHFVQGVQLQQSFWKKQDICLITEGVTLSGLALRLFNKYLPADIYIALPQRQDYKYIRQLRKSVCGGLSQVYHRFHMSGTTKIRNGAHLCRTVVGWDFNRFLYLCELGMEMPVGVAFEWMPHLDKKRQTVYKRKIVLPDFVSLRELEYLSYEAWKRQKRIKHYLSAKRQFKVPGSNYRADGFLPPNLIFEFNGKAPFFSCHVHSHQLEDPGCPCKPLPGNEEEIYARLNQTKDKVAYMRKRGFVVLEMNSCEWEKKRKTDPEIVDYLQTRFYPDRKTIKQTSFQFHEMINMIKEGLVFGIAMVDIETPVQLREKFSIMQPLILNRTVERSDLGEFMENYCVEHDHMRNPRRVLGQAFSAKNMLLITPLLKWYIEMGLVVTKLHWVRQFNSNKVFQPLVDMVTEYRKAADQDPSLTLQGTSMKLTGNSIFGKTLETGANYTDVRLTNEDGLKRAVERPNFRSSDDLSDDMFEVETGRARVTEDNPLIIGNFILQYSKLRMLKFVFEFLDAFIPRELWQPCLTDTDSLYVALAGENLDCLVPKCNWDEYCAAKRKFLVCDSSEKRKPGLMKQEWKGDSIIALAPKTYICFNNNEMGGQKMSHKGTQASNRLEPIHYYKVLRSQARHTVTNKGLWYKNGRFVKYSQKKSGLPYLITKMQTQADGITLHPLPEPEGGVDSMIGNSDDSDSENQDGKTSAKRQRKL